MNSNSDFFYGLFWCAVGIIFTVVAVGGHM